MSIDISKIERRTNSMAIKHPLRIAIEAGQELKVGNNELKLRVKNLSTKDCEQVILRLKPSPGIQVRPAKLEISPLKANSTESVLLKLYAGSTGHFTINLHASTFPVPKEGFLNTTLPVDVLPQSEAQPFLENETIFDQLLGSSIFHEQLSDPETAREESAQQGDVYSLYETGLSQLLNQMKNHTRYGEALTYQQRLKENIAQARRFGDTETRRSERNEIIDQLNELALSTVGISFNELCEQ